MERIKSTVEEIKIGAKFKVECLNFSHEGKGICKIQGLKEGEMYENFPVFVDYFLPKEKGIIEITKLSKTYGYAKLVTLFKETKSADHIIPMCQTYGVCGGCNLMHLSYRLQLQFKREMVEETIKKIGNIQDVEILPVIGMNQPIAYRNKVQVPFRKKGIKTVCGFFKRDSHEIIPFEKCYIQPDLSTEIIHFVRNILNEFQVVGYNEKNHSGLVRHVLVRTNFNLSEAMVVLVLTSNQLPHQQDIVNKITKRYACIRSIVININEKPGNTILGKTNITIYGKDTITDKLCGLEFHIGAQSFYQVNSVQTEILYRKVIELAALQKTDILIDAYCGIGTIGLIASKEVKEVYSVEIIPEAIDNAIENARCNQIHNIHFACEKAEVQIDKWLKKGVQANVIIVDPPRKGCDTTLLNTICEKNISRIVYVSCEPSTLARDLKYLVEKGYCISKVQPIDMFPQTSNVECVVCLERR